MKIILIYFLCLSHRLFVVALSFITFLYNHCHTRRMSVRKHIGYFLNPQSTMNYVKLIENSCSTNLLNSSEICRNLFRISTFYKELSCTIIYQLKILILRFLQLRAFSFTSNEIVGRLVICKIQLQNFTYSISTSSISTCGILLIILVRSNKIKESADKRISPERAEQTDRWKRRINVQILASSHSCVQYH